MDLNAIKGRLNELQSQGQKKEKVDFSKFIWKPKEEGKYQIRIVPSKFNKTNPFKEVFLHYGVSKFPIYALTNWGEKDPIVEFSQLLRKSESKEDWRLSRKLEPKMRIFAPVIVRGEEDKGVRLWEFGKEVYMTLLGIAEDEDYGDFTDINDGYDFTIKAVKGDIGGGRQGLKSTIQIKPKTSKLSEDKNEVKKWLEEQPDVLEIQKVYKMDFDKLKGILKNFLNPEAESEETTQEETITDSKPIDISTKTSKKSDKFNKLFEESESN